LVKKDFKIQNTESAQGRNVDKCKIFAPSVCDLRNYFANLLIFCKNKVFLIETIFLFPSPFATSLV